MGAIGGSVVRVSPGLTLQTMPVGKLLDILVVQTRTPRSASDDPRETLEVVCLSETMNGDRRISRLLLADQAEAIEEGSLVVLVKGYMHSPT